MTDLRVEYDRPETVYEMLDWLVDSDPIELRNFAQNLLEDVETLKARLAAAEQRGYADAVAKVRQLPDALFLPREVADYLESLTNKETQ